MVVVAQELGYYLMQLGAYDVLCEFLCVRARGYGWLGKAEVICTFLLLVLFYIEDLCSINFSLNLSFDTIGVLQFSDLLQSRVIQLCAVW